MDETGKKISDEISNWTKSGNGKGVKSSYIKNKPLVLLGMGAIAVFVIFFTTLSIFIIRTKLINLQYSDICPDYHMTYNAYIVDLDGNGVDSVIITMKDLTNFNIIYNTFTDSTGKFELFNDFNAHSLYTFPMPYDLFVTIGNYKDTIVYSFERYRGCHFKKLNGPDTIVVDPAKDAHNTLLLDRYRSVPVENCFDYTPFLQTHLTSQKPSGLKEKIKGWKFSTYGNFTIGKREIQIATVSIPDKSTNSNLQTLNSYSDNTLFYIIDKNTNGTLNDDPVRQWSGCGNSQQQHDVLCMVSSCCATDTIHVDGNQYILNLKIRTLKDNTHALYYQRADAKTGTITIDSKTISIAIWDRGITNYRNRSLISVAIDKNNDGHFSTGEGENELFEHILRPIIIDSITFSIDSIINNGTTLLCSKIKTIHNTEGNVMKGSWVRDFNAYHAEPIYLHQECAKNNFVVLYFFEGNSKTNMERNTISILISLMRKHLGKISYIGINRKSTGDIYLKEPVIEENRGWHGAIVSQFHNHLLNEIICLDNVGTIVYRGGPGKIAIEKIWETLKPNDKASVLGEYNAIVKDNFILGKSNN